MENEKHDDAEKLSDDAKEEIKRRNMYLAWYKEKLSQLGGLIKEKETTEKELLDVIEQFVTVQSFVENERTALIKERAAFQAEQSSFISNKAKVESIVLTVLQEEQAKLKKRTISNKQRIFHAIKALISFPILLYRRLHFYMRTRNKGLLFPTPRLFWSKWYRFQYDDVPQSMEPYFHYLVFGVGENRLPNPLFDGNFYLKQNPDVAAAGVNPFVHYITHGWKEGRNPGPYFDVLWYLSNNPDVLKAKINPLHHYLEYGWKENRQPVRSFSAKKYIRRYQHLKKLGWSNFDFLKFLLYKQMEESILGLGDDEENNPRAVLPAAPALNFNKHTILFVGHDAFRAGSQMVLLHLLRWLRKHTSLELRILLLSGGALLQEFKEIAPTLVISETQNEKSDEVHARILEFCNGEPDLIYCNTAVIAKHMDLFPWNNVPFLFHIHELENIIEALVGVNEFDHAAGQVSRFIAVSSPVKQNLIENHKVSETSIELAYPFIDPPKRLFETYDKQALRRQLGMKEKGFIVFGCGTIDHRKGVDIFVDVAKALLDMGKKDFHFYWIGRQMSDTENILKKYNENKLEGFITFLGEKEFPSEYFAAGDVFILPSREDPFPLVCLEAAECGLPVICFDKAGGMPHFVEEDAGFVTPYLDPAVMAEKISILMGNEGLRSKLGTRAQEKIRERHLVDAVAPHILKTIHDTAHIKPTVSVIVPCFSHAEFLPKRLDSIFNQTYRDYEVILLDDASKDSTKEILNKYVGMPNVYVEINKENSGSTFAQWIKGIKRAKGDIIWIAEDDDFCEYDFLEKLLPFFNDPDVKLAYSQSYAVDDKNEKLFSYINHTHEFSPTRWQEPYLVTADEEVNFGLSITNTIPNASAVLFRPFAPEEWYELSQKMKLAGDWLFYLIAAHDGKVAFTPEHLNYHRRHANTNIHRTQFSDRRFKEIVLAQRFAIKRYTIKEETKQRMKKYTQRVWNSIYPDRANEFESEYEKILNDSTELDF